MTRETVRRWKSSWDDFLQKVSEELDDLDWCWYTEALLLYRRERQRVDDALQSTLDHFDEWPMWKTWMEQAERIRPAASERSNPPRLLKFPSDLPTPPEEPAQLWTKTQQLLNEGDRLEAIGAAVVRLALAKGRAARQVHARQ